MNKKKTILSILAVLATSSLWISYSPMAFAGMNNGDEVDVKVTKGAWTNGNLLTSFNGTGDNISIGGNDGSS